MATRQQPQPTKANAGSMRRRSEPGVRVHVILSSDVERSLRLLVAQYPAGDRRSHSAIVTQALAHWMPMEMRRLKRKE